MTKARKMSDELLDKIGKGTAANMFPKKYFEEQQTREILENLRSNCDFENRTGSFINDYTSIINESRTISFIYEFKLKCGDYRFITTYTISSEIELMEVRLESPDEYNPHIKK